METEAILGIKFEIDVDLERILQMAKTVVK